MNEPLKEIVRLEEKEYQLKRKDTRNEKKDFKSSNVCFNSDEERDEADERHLLAQPSIQWQILEDTKQANCIALNKRNTLLAIGEKEGRISIWDNVSMRVMICELDPTVIQILEEKKEQDQFSSSSVISAEKNKKDEQKRPIKKLKSNPKSFDDSSLQEIIEVESDPTESNTKEEGDDDDEETVNSTEEEEEEEEEEEFEEEQKEADEDVAEDEEEDEEEEDDDEEEENEDDESAEEEEVEEEKLKKQTGDTTSSKKFTELSADELRILKSGLKVVTSCAWSGNGRMIFAGCEEKGPIKKSRLVVWDVEEACVLSTFGFDGIINCVSGHPKDPNIVLLSVHNSEPILLNVVTNSTKKLNLPFAEEIATSTASTNSSKNPYLLVCAKYGRSGKKIYCLSSKSTLSIYDSQTLDCISNISDDNTLPSVPNVDISITRDESHLICTTSKGVLEFNTKNLSEEPKVYATGSVRAPWSICCYSGDENFVVGLPVQRLRYVGEQGFYSWNRRSFRMQHNMGLKDGISTIEWEPLKQSLIAISSTGGLFYLEEDFKSNWAGPMYPAGFRLLTDNEWYMEPEDEFDIKPNQDEHDLSKDKSLVVDVFTKSKSLHGFDEPLEKDELLYLSSIPIFSQFKRHGQVLPVPGGSQNNPVEEKTFGFQSVFEPMPKSLQKAKEMALNRWSNTSKTISKKSKKKKRR